MSTQCFTPEFKEVIGPDLLDTLMAVFLSKTAIVDPEPSDCFGRTADSYNFRAQPINSKKNTTSRPR